MTKEILYKRVGSVCPMERSIFEEDLICARDELCAMFGEKYVLDGENDLTVKNEYFTALCSALLYFHTGEESDRRRFVERARNAFLTVWKARADKRRREESADASDGI